jgi:hypothetical protein
MRRDAIGIIRSFHTKNFSVVVDALPEDRPVDVDDDGETARLIDEGVYIHFTARVSVRHKRLGVIGEDFLGGCIYESIDAFQDHRACGKQNRQWAAEGKSGRCGSYFSEMIREAIKEARDNIVAAQGIHVRAS